MFDLFSLSFFASFPPSLWVLVAAVFVLGGFVKGAVGLGLPTITMGLLSLAMLPAQAAALLVVPSFITNLWQIGGSGFFALLKRLATLLIGVCAGVALGAGWLGGGALATVGLGLALGASLGMHGALRGPALTASAFVVVPALLGMGAGQWLRGRLRAETFKTMFFAGLLLLGAYLAIRGGLQLWR